MEINKIYEVYFSPTGGTKRAADILAASLGGDLEIVDITDYEDGLEEHAFGPEELVIFAVPVYGGRVPETALEKIKKMSGNNTPAVLQAVYGNRDYDDALLELKNVVSGLGFVPVAAVAAVAEHSIMRKYGAGRPDESDQEQLKEFGAGILEKLERVNNSVWFSEFKVKGNLDYRQYNGVPLKPKAGKECKKCGLCSVKCPVRAIPFENPDETDANICISCMRCISVCPAKARSLNKVMLAASEAALSKALKERKNNEFFYQ